MAHDVSYLLHRAETEAVRAIGCDSDHVAAVHQEMCLLYTGQAIAALLVTALDKVRRSRSEPASSTLSRTAATG